MFTENHDFLPCWKTMPPFLTEDITQLKQMSFNKKNFQLKKSKKYFMKD